MLTTAIHPTTVTAAVSALAAGGLTLLLVRPRHDLARSTGVVGALAGAVGAATVAHYTLMDRRLARIEDVTGRIATIEADVLEALQAEPH